MDPAETARILMDPSYSSTLRIECGYNLIRWLDRGGFTPHQLVAAPNPRQWVRDKIKELEAL